MTVAQGRGQATCLTEPPPRTEPPRDRWLLSCAKGYNSSLSSFQSQADDHFGAAVAVGIIGGLLTGALLRRRRRLLPTGDPGRYVP